MTHRIVCSWCRTELHAGGDPASHGICEDCRRNYFPDAAPPKPKWTWRDTFALVLLWLCAVAMVFSFLSCGSDSLPTAPTCQPYDIATVSTQKLCAIPCVDTYIAPQSTCQFSPAGPICTTSPAYTHCAK